MSDNPKMGRPKAFLEPSEIQSQWEVYKRKCDTHKVEAVSAGKVKSVLKPRVYTLQKFQSEIGISRECWGDYRVDPDFSDTIKEIEAQVLGRKVEALTDGEGSTTGLIFDLRVNSGWQDKQVIESKVQVTSVEVTVKPAVDNYPIATDEKDIVL